MASPLCQVGVCRYRHAGPGARRAVSGMDGLINLTFSGPQISELVMKRRKWLNNSFFAAILTTLKFHYIYRSSHSIWRKLWIHVELLYQTFSLVFSWFAAVRLPHIYKNRIRILTSSRFWILQGNFFLSFVILTNALEDPTIIGGKTIEVTNTVLKYFYVGLLLTCFVLALQVGVRPRGSNRGYALALVGYAALTGYVIVRHRDGV
jgi:chitin synthase